MSLKLYNKKIMLFSVNNFEKRNVSGISLHSAAFLFSLTLKLPILLQSKAIIRNKTVEQVEGLKYMDVEHSKCVATVSPFYNRK